MTTGNSANIISVHEFLACGLFECFALVFVLPHASVSEIGSGSGSDEVCSHSERMFVLSLGCGFAARHVLYDVSSFGPKFGGICVPVPFRTPRCRPALSYWWWRVTP